MTEGPAFIPEAVDELSPEWLTQALHARGHLPADAHVEKVSAETIGDGEGFMGVIARLSLHFEGDPGKAPHSLIVKLPTQSLDNRVMGEMLGAYWREIHFYEELASEVPVRVPALYYSALTPDTMREKSDDVVRVLDRFPGWLVARLNGLTRWLVKRNAHRYVLLIEDLAPARVGDQLRGGAPEACEPVLRAAAAMHARYWNDGALGDRFWLARQTAGARMRQRIFRQAAPRFRARYPELMASADPNGPAAIVDWLEANGMVLSLALHAEAPQTLLHCDFRLDNVYFAEAGEEEQVIFGDWQMTGYGAAAYDVAYLLSGALTTEITEREERALLGTYHEALRAGGVDYPFESLLRDYKRSLFSVLHILASTDQVEMGDGRGVPLMDAWVERTFRRLRDVRLDAVL